VKDQAGALLARTDMRVAVREPATLLLLGSGLAGAGIAARRLLRI
jgi:hypothetical protein